jgi:hypothetical protein
MTELIIFWSVFILGFLICYRLLLAIDPTHINKLFKRGNAFIINLMFFMISTVFGYILAALVNQVITLINAI